MLRARGLLEIEAERERLVLDRPYARADTFGTIHLLATV